MSNRWNSKWSGTVLLAICRNLCHGKQRWGSCRRHGEAKLIPSSRLSPESPNVRMLSLPRTRDHAFQARENGGCLELQTQVTHIKDNALCPRCGSDLLRSSNYSHGRDSDGGRQVSRAHRARSAAASARRSSQRSLRRSSCSPVRSYCRILRSGVIA
jgi:hypothetical protein